MIEAHGDGGFSITGEHIPLYRLMVMASGLKLEIQGICMNRGRTCYAIAKSELGFKGNKSRVLAQLQAHIETVKAELSDPTLLD
jgi:uncharacterized protein (DUF2141 family)